MGGRGGGNQRYRRDRCVGGCSSAGVSAGEASTRALSVSARGQKPSFGLENHFAKNVRNWISLLSSHIFLILGKHSVSRLLAPLGAF